MHHCRMWIIITFVAFVDTIPNSIHEEYYGLHFYKQLAWCEKLLIP